MPLLVLAACGSGDEHAVGSVRLPPAGARFDYQLGGDAPLPDGVTVVARDWQEGTPPGGGLYAICYVNAFQSQPGVDWPEQVVTEFEDPEWPGEFVIDLSTPTLRATALSRATEMIQVCAAHGFDAVEFDNLDTFTRFDGLPFGKAEAQEYARLLVGAAHDAGLAAAQKNTPELALDDLGFDFAVVEQCGEYSECAAFTAGFGDLVFDIEYTDSGLSFACATMREGASVIRRDLDLVLPDDPAYVYATCRSALAVP